MENYTILVEEILGGEQPSTPNVKLGDENIEQNVNSMLREMRVGTRAFRLKWQGSRVPRGAVVAGHPPIIWTQHGRVMIEDGSQIGSYDRIIDCVNGQNEMIVYLRPEA